MGATDHFQHLRADHARLGGLEGRHPAGVGLVRHPFPGHGGGHEHRLVLAEQADRLAVEIGPVLDGISAGAQEGVDAGHAVGVRGDAPAHHVGGLHDGVQLLLEELLLHARAGGRQHAPGGGDLDHVGAFLDQLAHGARAIVRPVAGVRAAGFTQDAHRPAVRIAVPAGRRHGAAGDAHARTDIVAGLHPVAQGAHGLHVPADILDRGEARTQGAPGVEHAVDGVVRRAFGEVGDAAARPLLTGDVNVGVDESRHHGVVGEVDDRGALRRHEAAFDRLDPVPAHQDRHVTLRARLARRRDERAGVNDGERRSFVLCECRCGGHGGGANARQCNADH